MKFDVLSAWTKNGVGKIDIRKSIISRKNRHKEIDHLTDRTGHDCVPKLQASQPRHDQQIFHVLSLYSVQKVVHEHAAVPANSPHAPPQHT